MSDFPRREFLKSIVAGSLGIGVTGASPAASSSRYSVPFVRSGRQATQPNIVWIIAEDMGPDLGCYGTEAVYTPHIDALAEEGMQFDQAFAVSPVCSPNRSALHTGCWPRSIDAHNHRSNRSDDPTPPNPLERVRTMPTLLREAGYYTGLIEDLGASAKMDWNFDPLGTPWDTRSWSDVRAAARDQPFFAEFNFPDTHRDFHGVGAVDPGLRVVGPDDTSSTRAGGAYTTVADSEEFASIVQNQFKERVKRRSRGVHQAGFLVLWSASMPSVLVELGYLTNRQEARFLDSNRGQTYLASAIFRAVRKYKTQYNKGIVTSEQGAR